mmetsp:Transcript_102681/g.290377  ORF Transcript_102681/g.290377 Transcript_102681/m.290377 type:complete len:126 (+) Transcript_102681:1-378(+)
MQGGSIVLEDWAVGPFWSPDIPSDQEGEADPGPDVEATYGLDERSRGLAVQDWREGPFWRRGPELGDWAEAQIAREPTWCEAHGAADSSEPTGQPGPQQTRGGTSIGVATRSVQGCTTSALVRRV